jgi:hypothetical protein
MRRFFVTADEPLIAPVAAVRITPEELYEPEPAPVVAQPAQEPGLRLIQFFRRNTHGGDGRNQRLVCFFKGDGRFGLGRRAYYA